MTLLSILIIIISVLLVLVVIIQNSKGGGLDANIASQNQSFGAKKTTEIVEKVTWYLIGALAILCIVSTKSVSTGESESGQENSTNQTTQQDDTGK
ncbi:MAG: preprotein translocase subunit SecG [Flavobacteriales bacterium]